MSAALSRCRLLSGLLGPAVLAAACGGDPSPGGAADSGHDADPDVTTDTGSDAPGDAVSDAGPDNRVEFELHESTVLLEGAALDALLEVRGLLDSDGVPDVLGEVTLHMTTAGAADIEAGDVIVAGISPQTPWGLLRRVVSVAPEGDGVALVTGPASVAQAFRRLDFEVTGEIPQAGLVFVDDGEPRLTQKDGDSGGDDVQFGGPIDWVVFDGDGDPATEEDRIRLHGVIEANASYFLGLSYDIDVLDSLNIFDEFPPDISAVDIDLRIGASASFGTTVDVTLEGQAALGYEKSIPLGPPVYLSPIAVGPLVFVPRVRAIGEIEGRVPGSFSIHAVQTAGFEATAQFSVSDGFEATWTPPFVDTTEPAVDVELAATAEARLILELDFLLYGVVGPTAGIGAHLGASADIGRDPCWEVSAGLDAYIGLLVELFSVELVNKRWDIPITSTVIGSGECPFGQAADPAPSWSRAWLDASGGTAASDETFGTLTTAIDGNVLVAGRSSRGLLKLTPTGALVWARAWRRTDTVLVEDVQVEAALTRPDGGVLVAGRNGTLLWLSASGQLARAGFLDSGSAQPLSFPGALRASDGTSWLAFPHFDEDFAKPDAVFTRIAPDGTAHAVRWGDPEWSDRPRDLVQWGDHVVALVVSQNFAADPDTVSWLVEFELDGTFVRSLRLSDCEEADEVALRTAAVSEDGHLVLGGYGRFSAPRGLLVNVAPDGTLGWTSAFAIPSLLGYDVTGLAQLPTGAWIVAGTRVLAAPDDVFVARTDSIGRVTWLRTMGGEGSEAAPELLSFADGTVLLAASSSSFGEGETAWWASLLDVRDGLLPVSGAPGVAQVDETPTEATFCVGAERIDVAPGVFPVTIAPATVEEMPWSPAALTVGGSPG